MTDHELNSITDASKEIRTTLRRLRWALAYLEDNSHAERERIKISEALDLLIAASDMLYRKEHGH